MALPCEGNVSVTVIKTDKVKAEAQKAIEEAKTNAFDECDKGEQPRTGCSAELKCRFEFGPTDGVTHTTEEVFIEEPGGKVKGYRCTATVTGICKCEPIGKA